MQKAQSWSSRTRVIIRRKDKVVLRKERMALIRRHLDQNLERVVISEKNTEQTKPKQISVEQISRNCRASVRPFY